MNLKYIYNKVFKKIRGSAVKNSIIHKTSKIESGSQVVNSNFDKHSFCGYDCDIINTNVGSFCSIANNVKIGGGMHPINWVSTSPVFYAGRDSVKSKFSTHEREDLKTTYIGHDVWIGEGAIIKQGVKIGNGAVIGMGSIVTKDVAPYAIVGGNPAKLIRMRFDQETIDGLSKLEWWNFDEKKLTKYAVLFTDPKKFIETINSKML